MADGLFIQELRATDLSTIMKYARGYNLALRVFLRIALLRYGVLGLKVQDVLAYALVQGLSKPLVTNVGHLVMAI
jgi:hypothetical protein